jgi:hypothetical protein
MKPELDSPVQYALLDLSRAARNDEASWALVGGQALRMHGVHRQTLDADVMVPTESAETIAQYLVSVLGWMPLKYSSRAKGYVKAKKVEVHRMDDPVLFDIQEQRLMIPLLTPFDLVFELICAQHPVEQDMITFALPVKIEHFTVFLAPLGGVLLVKVKADRAKDIGAVEQAVEGLPGTAIKEAIAWAKKRDPETAADISSIAKSVDVRRTPISKNRQKH